MKQVLLFSFTVVVGINAFSQGPGKTVKLTTNKPVANPVLKTMNDTFSYALGVQVAAFYKQQGVKKINTVALSKAINDIYTNGKSSLSQNDVDLSILAETSPEQYKVIKANIVAGQKFLKEKYCRKF